MHIIQLVDLIYWIDDIVQPDGCPDRATKMEMDEAMAKYIDDFTYMDVKDVVDSGEPVPVKAPAGSTQPVTHAPFTIKKIDDGLNSQRDRFIVHYSAPIEM